MTSDLVRLMLIWPVEGINEKYFIEAFLCRYGFNKGDYAFTADRQTMTTTVTLNRRLHHGVASMLGYYAQQIPELRNDQCCYYFDDRIMGAASCPWYPPPRFR